MRAPARLAAAAALLLAAPAAAPASPAQENCPPATCLIHYGPYFIFFDPGSSRMDWRAATVINNVSFFLRRFSPPALFVAGHSDRAGPDSANLALSCRRAEAARGWLVAMGHPPERIIAIGFGETKPIEPTADGIAQAENRYVEFMFAESLDHRPRGRWTRCRTELPR